MNPIITLLIFTSLTATTPAVQKKEQIPVKESIFITMERTPCFGKCPSYKITIFNTGNVIYEGLQFAFKKGKFTKKLTKSQLNEIDSQVKKLHIFELKDVYDSMITDIPSCKLYFNFNGKIKKILER